MIHRTRIRRLQSRGALVCVCLALALMASRATAEEPPPRIEPDRRDFTTGTGIVPEGHIQVEAGTTAERGDAERLVTIGEITVRIPLASAVEVHLDLPSYLVRNDGRRHAGFDDAGIELRYKFLKTEFADFGVQATTMLPTGTRRVAERRFQPGIVAATTIDLGRMSSLALNIGVSSATDDGRRYTQTFTAGSFRLALAERISGFVEAYAFNREAADGDSHRYVATGLVLFLDRDTALDARIGRGIRNGDGTDWLLGFGISHRF